jgi:uncharacterized cupin superfamily protein
MTKPSVIRFDANAAMDAWDEFPASDIVAGSRKQSGKLFFEDKANGLTAGLWAQPGMESPWMDYPVNEFMALLEGEVTIEEKDRSLTVKAGESFIIPKGTHCRWVQKGPVKKFFVIHDDASGKKNEGELHAVKIDPKADLKPSTPPSADMLLSPVPAQRDRNYFTDATGQLIIGLWDTEPYHRKLIDFPRHELMMPVAGAVTFEDGQGGTEHYKAGDVFFVPMGTPNAWISKEYLRKIYVIFVPKKG